MTAAGGATRLSDGSPLEIDPSPGNRRLVWGGMLHLRYLGSKKPRTICRQALALPSRIPGSYPTKGQPHCSRKKSWHALPSGLV